MSEKHKSVEKHPFKWLSEKFRKVTDRAMKLGFGVAGIGVLIAVGGYLAGAGAVGGTAFTVAKFAFNSGIIVGVLGAAGKLIAGEPEKSFSHK